MILRVFTISTLCFIATTLLAQSEMDSLWRVANDGNDTIAKVDALNRIAFLLRSTNPDSTLIIGRQSERLAQEYDYPLGLADAKMRRAIAHSTLGNYYRSLQLYLEAKTAYESLGAQDRIASTLNNVGRLYNFIEDYDRALDFYQQAASLHAEMDELSKEGSSLNNIGYIHKLQGNYAESLKFLKMALDRARRAGTAANEIYPIYNIGSVYMKQDRFDSAQYYLEQSLNMAQDLRNQYILSLTLIDMGQMHMKMGATSGAEACFKEAYAVSTKAGMRSEQRDAAQYLSKVYEDKGETGEALRFFKIYKATNDSLFNRDLARRIAFQEAEYEYRQMQIKEEIEREKAELEQEKALNNAIWIRNTLIVGLVVMIAFTYLVYRNYRRNQKANEELRALNEQIEQQSQELRSANHEIIVMNNNLEKVVNRRTKELKLRNQQLKEYLSSNSHLVRAPLARILGLVDLYEPGDTNNLDFINKSLQESATELDNALRLINERLSEHDN